MSLKLQVRGIMIHVEHPKQKINLADSCAKKPEKKPSGVLIGKPLEPAASCVASFQTSLGAAKQLVQL